MAEEQEEIQNLEEQVVLEEFRDLRKQRFGRLELAVVDGKLETIHHTKTIKRKDFLKKT